MPVTVEPSELKSWVAAFVSFIVGLIGFGAFAQKLKGRLDRVESAVLDDKGKPIVITLDDCRKNIFQCDTERSKRRSEDREDLRNELQNIHSAITGLNEQFKTIAGEIGELRGAFRASNIKVHDK